MQGVLGITVDCSGQCTFTSIYQNYQCVDLVNDLGIQCSQPSCSTRVYNLSTCVTAENGIIIRDTTIQTNVGNGVVNDMTTEQSQARIPTTVHRTETTEGNVLDNCNTNQQSTTVAALAIMVVILIVLLVIVSIALIWTCWTFKIKGATKSQYQQHR